jgi:hypothetical protein
LNPAQATLIDSAALNVILKPLINGRQLEMIFISFSLIYFVPHSLKAQTYFIGFADTLQAAKRGSHNLFPK